MKKNEKLQTLEFWVHGILHPFSNTSKPLLLYHLEVLKLTPTISSHNNEILYMVGDIFDNETTFHVHN